MNFVLIAMILALLIPLYEAGKVNNGIWEKMLSFASFSIKTAIIILVISVMQDDWMLGVVGILILTVGDAGFMLLAHLLKRMNEA